MDKKLLESLGWSKELIDSVLEIKFKIDSGAVRVNSSLKFDQSLNRADSSSFDSTELDPVGSNHIALE